MIAFYLFAAVLLSDGQWAQTPAIPYATREECETVRTAAMMQMDMDDSVKSYHISCEEMTDTSPGAKPAKHIPGKSEA